MQCCAMQYYYAMQCCAMQYYYAMQCCAMPSYAMLCSKNAAVMPCGCQRSRQTCSAAHPPRLSGSNHTCLAKPCWCLPAAALRGASAGAVHAGWTTRQMDPDMSLTLSHNTAVLSLGVVFHPPPNLTWWCKTFAYAMLSAGPPC